VTVRAVDHEHHGEIASDMHSFILIPDDVSELKLGVLIAVLNERETLVLIDLVVIALFVILLLILLLLALN
jgi:hypothetical protein